MTCPSPIPYETLVALWAGELTGADADAVDEHLFACDRCAAASEQLGVVLATMRELIPPVMTRAQRDQLAARGLRILDLAFDPGARGEATFARELDLLVFTLRGDFAGAERVDVEVGVEGLPPVMECLHVPFDPARGEVLIACQQHFRDMAALYPGDPEFRVFATAAGTRRMVGSYVIKHIWPPV